MPDKDLRILHVDDDADTREIVAVTLDIFGAVDLIQFASGAVALDHAEAFGPDVVLLDYQMPGMTGLDILHRLNAMPGMSRAAVVFMTGRSDEREIRLMQEAGATSVIVKPFEPADLLTALQAARDRARAPLARQDKIA